MDNNETLELKSYLNLLESKDSKLADLILKENMYSLKDMEIIDNAYQEILDKCVYIDPKSKRDTSGKKYALVHPNILDKQLTIIEKQVKKIFNIDLNIKIDYATKNLEYFACIFLTDKDIEKAKQDIEEIIEDEKFGFHYIKVKKADMNIQVQALYYTKDFNGERKLNGRHLTAVMLHELGHKIYLRLAYHKNEDEYIVQVNDMKPKKFKALALNSSQKKKNLLSEIVTFSIVTILFFLTIDIIQYISMIQQIKEYVRIESYSDRLAVQYGYGKEIYQFFITIELFTKGKLTTDKSFFLTKLTNSDYLRRKEMKRDIMIEINNPHNSKKQVEQLKEILKFIEEVEKDAEQGNYRYSLAQRKEIKKNFQIAPNKNNQQRLTQH